MLPFSVLLLPFFLCKGDNKGDILILVELFCHISRISYLSWDYCMYFEAKSERFSSYNNILSSSVGLQNSVKNSKSGCQIAFPNPEQNSLKFWLSNCFILSLTIVSGTPNLQMMDLQMISVIFL